MLRSIEDNILPILNDGLVHCAASTLRSDEKSVVGLYCTGWVTRAPLASIGSNVECTIEDVAAGNSSVIATATLVTSWSSNGHAHVSAKGTRRSRVDGGRTRNEDM